MLVCNTGLSEWRCVWAAGDEWLKLRRGKAEKWVFEIQSCGIFSINFSILFSWRPHCLFLILTSLSIISWLESIWKFLHSATNYALIELSQCLVNLSLQFVLYLAPIHHIWLYKPCFSKPLCTNNVFGFLLPTKSKLDFPQPHFSAPIHSSQPNFSLLSFMKPVL